MFLNQKLAQKLVDNIMVNLGYNINLMNQSGVIIASGSKERIGTYHNIAEKVIKSNKRIDIYKDEENEYKGVKEGINMPFYYNKQLAGVIGITGDPKEIENAAEMVRMVTELMLEQESLKERIYSHQNQKTFFVNKLLSLDDQEEVSTVIQWGKKLGYNLTIPRIVCLFSIRNMDKLIKNNSLLTKDKIKEHVLECIKTSKYHTKQDVSSFININNIIIFKSISTRNKLSSYEQVQQYIEWALKNISDNLNIKLIIGVGTLYKDIYDIKESYKEAKVMVDYGIASNMNSKVIYAQKHIFEYLFTDIDKIKIEHFLNEYIKKIEDKPELIETIESLIHNDMNILRTSKELYVHRNTIIFRLNKIKELLSVDPIHDETDRTILHLLSLYTKYYKNTK